MAEPEAIGAIDPKIEEMWRTILTSGHRHRLAALPGAPKCAICHVPIAGVTGQVVTLTTGIRVSRKNPGMCNLCEEGLPPGGAEIDMAVLFADVRGSTTLGERMEPSAFAALMNRFYKAANSALLPQRAVIDKMLGDEVMAFFIPGITGGHHRTYAVKAAIDLLRAVGYGTAAGGWMPVGVSVHAGPAYVGKIGSPGVHDFTCLGDTVNTGARLQNEAAAGQVVISEEAYREVAGDYPDLERRVVNLRGKEDAVPVRVLQVGLPASS